MKLFFLFGIFSSSHLFAQSNETCAEKNLNEQYSILEEKDRIIRTKYGDMERLALSKGQKLSEEDRKKFSTEARKIDDENQATLDILVGNCGWPKGKIFFGTNLSAAFFIVQHGTLEFQLKYYPLVKESVKMGDTPELVFAYLEDRILMKQGKPQRYGTQSWIGKDGQYTVGDIEDPDHLNERRTAIGLQVMPGYP
ncbi:DUF6624 domain-containing protein [Undibacterium sp. Di27W]|uniref:DUF6624 domain-containing protein n=1 Tax=Undibacterium sp. Di27W TaxID=3413036 RepID=UPI003BEFD67D